MENKKKNKTFSLIIYSVFLVVCLTILGITVSYAFVGITSSNNYGSYTAKASIECIDLAYNESGVITLNDQYPLKDPDGLKLQPVVVTIRNTCSNAVTFDLAFTSLIKTDKQYINDNQIKINVQSANTNTTRMVSSLSPLNSSSGNAYTYLTNDLRNRTTVKDYAIRSSYYIFKGTSVNANSTNTYSIRIWIDYYEGDTTQTGQKNNDTQGKSYAAAISAIVA